MKKTLTFALAMSLAFTVSMALAQSTKAFPDVPKDHWAYQAVMELKEKGILIGYPGGSFNGEGSQGKQSTNPVYDSSTPEKTWRSLLTAMRNRDDAAIRYLTTESFKIEGNVPEAVSRLFSSNNGSFLKRRLDLYQKQAPVWEKWEFFTAYVDHLEEVIGRAEPFIDQIGGPYVRVEFKKTAIGWKIINLFYDTE